MRDIRRRALAWLAAMVFVPGVLGLGLRGEIGRTGTTLSGTTRTAGGAPLDGVAVSARAVDKTFTTTVYADKKGEYVFPALESGKYSAVVNKDHMVYTNVSND